MKNILKYTEYKTKQALWIQIENSKRTNKGTNTEQFCIECYWDYLKLIGFKIESVFEKMQNYHNAIGTYHLEVEDEFYNKGYDENIAKNINKLMDQIL
jgi:hypothetical protein